MLAFRTVQQSNHCAREEFLYYFKAASGPADYQAWSSAEREFMPH